MNVKIRAFRSDMAAVLNTVESERKRVTICRHHDPVAVLVPVQELRELDEIRRAYTFRANGKSSH